MNGHINSMNGFIHAKYNFALTYKIDYVLLLLSIKAVLHYTNNKIFSSIKKTSNIYITIYCQNTISLLYLLQVQKLFR